MIKKKILRVACVWVMLLFFAIACSRNEGNNLLGLWGVEKGKAQDDFSFAKAFQKSLNTKIKLKPPSVSNSPNATFKFSCSIPPCSFKCQLDGASWQKCKSPQSYSFLADGLHTFKVKAVNKSLGISDPTPAKYSWTINSAQTAEGYELNETIKLLENKGYTVLIKTSYQKMEDTGLEIYKALYSDGTRTQAIIVEYVVDKANNVYRSLVTEFLPSGEALVYDFLENETFKISSDGTVTALSTQLSPRSQFLIGYSSASCDYFNNQMIKCVKNGFLSASVSAISCVIGGTLGEVLKLLDDIKQPLEAILSVKKGDLIGVISAGAPCGVEIFLCLTKDFDPHLQCNDGDICNGDEYCSPDNTCHNSNYIAPDGTQCYASGLVSGKCQEGVCVSLCQPGGIWNITTKLTGQKGTCKIVEDETVIKYKCLGSESFSISVSEDGSNASLPGWSFNNNTCSGSASFSNGDGISTASITFEATQITACKFTANYPSADCTCTWSCSGSKAQ